MSNANFDTDTRVLEPAPPSAKPAENGRNHETTGHGPPEQLNSRQSLSGKRPRSYPRPAVRAQNP
jgi:hypothetical protein